MLKPLFYLTATASVIYGAVIGNRTPQPAIPVRWDPDPMTHGMTKIYTPDGWNCRQRGGQTFFECVDAKDEKSQPKHVGLSSAARMSLSGASRTLRSAAQITDSAQSSGRHEELAAAEALIEVAKRQIVQARKD